MIRNTQPWLALLLGCAVCALFPSPTRAQLDGNQLDGNQLDGLGGLGFEQEKPVVTATGQFTAPNANQPARLFITATLKPGWHIYSITQTPGAVKPSEIRLAESGDYRLAGPFEATPPPEKKAEPLFDNRIVESHYSEVVWHAPIELAPDADPAAITIRGALFAQPCDANSCRRPREFPFTAALGPGVSLPKDPAVVHLPDPGNSSPTQPPSGPSTDPPTGDLRPADSHDPRALRWIRVKTFAEINRIVENRIDLDQLEKNLREQEAGLDRKQGFAWPLTLILTGFLGGIGLNIMPCVLPVIGLKVFSFVNQAGQSRVRAFLLNLSFSAGLVSVFLILAAFAAGMQLNWGAQFQYPWFNATMAVVVFAMGLSFLGVWEIPIPGFVGSGKTADMAGREGLLGAFVLGIVTTILATPCTGPGMAFAVTMVMTEPPLLIFGVFGAVGLGMASPYLIMGAFPRLASALPKPGDWMDTFKQVMGFVLLATTVWILSFMHWPYLVPTVGLMFGVWAACWWIQRTPGTAELNLRAMAWLEAATFAGLVWVVMFPGMIWVPGLYEIMNERWQLASKGSTGDSVVPGRYTLMVDFTADWCWNCKVLEATVLQSKAVIDQIDQNRVVPVQMDMTDRPEDPDTKRFVRILRAAQPSLTVLPASDPNRPTFNKSGMHSQATVVAALKQAGPSIDPPR